MRDVEHEDTFLFEIVNMLGKVPHQAVLDRIKTDVGLSRGNLCTLVEAMELAGAGTAQTAQTADIHDVPDVYAMDAAYQLKHALEDMLRDMETGKGK